MHRIKKIHNIVLITLLIMWTTILTNPILNCLWKKYFVNSTWQANELITICDFLLAVPCLPWDISISLSRLLNHVLHMYGISTILQFTIIWLCINSSVSHLN